MLGALCQGAGGAARGGAEPPVPGRITAQGAARWKECTDDYTVALGGGTTGSYNAIAPAAGGLGRPALTAFRRSGNRFTVEPAGPMKTAAGFAAGGKAAAQAAGGGDGGTARGAAAQAAGAAGARPLKDRPPSETSLETKILRCLANCLECRHGLAEGEVVPVPPAQAEEHALGFDAVVGPPRGRCAVLQFKRPEKACYESARFEMGDRQALALRYPRGLAFYVLHGGPRQWGNGRAWQALPARGPHGRCVGRARGGLAVAARGES